MKRLYSSYAESISHGFGVHNFKTISSKNAKNILHNFTYFNWLGKLNK